ncbi:hypothetical protein [Pseudobutyrivibrio xylanivorans]|uniref:Uncharacterized protein n=1 Tax=Pseudobutyrivibrio xylanivorans DSM 14809 TaxID=1123012 RepID=A0A1M6ABY4_PSEXY|nr:hypothetical protein [Pseudobutyrivibrio xylanivorans]SHI34034.1 hypothetical protein SAMN02745725_00185 [Pseudobutyrivibrio xylanivorans DSM 14809]
MSNKTGFNRILACVAVFATVLVVLVSGLLLSENAGHQCNDAEHCPVCSLILQCEQNIKTIGSGLIAVATVIYVAKTMTELVTAFEYRSVQTTLVSQKVRLDS